MTISPIMPTVESIAPWFGTLRVNVSACPLVVRWRSDTFPRHLVSYHPDRTRPKPMLDGGPLVSRDGVSRPFSDSRDKGVFFGGGVLPAVGGAKLLEVFVPFMPIRDCESIQTNSLKGHFHTKKMRLWAFCCKRLSQKQQINVLEGHLSSANNS